MQNFVIKGNGAAHDKHPMTLLTLAGARRRFYSSQSSIV